MKKTFYVTILSILFFLSMGEINAADLICKYEDSAGGNKIQMLFKQEASGKYYYRDATGLMTETNKVLFISKKHQGTMPVYLFNWTTILQVTVQVN